MHISVLTITFLLLLPSFLSQENVTRNLFTPAEACNVTTNPDFCRVMLPQRGHLSLYNYSRYLVMKSLSQSTSLSSLINQTIAANASIPPRSVGALNDCILLTDLTIDFLQSTNMILSSNDTANLTDVEGEMVQSLLSAIVTNQETCHGGLREANLFLRNETLYAPVVNATTLYSISLDMFANCWFPKTYKYNATKLAQKRQLVKEQGDGVPYWVNRDLLRQNRWSKLDWEGVALKDFVVVSQNGSGNFTTINDALAAAPNNMEPGEGYFLIYVTAGVYLEYVSIDKKKRNILMVGDDINQTVITGNHNVGDGWTTFSSATLAVTGQGFVGVGITVQNTAGPAKSQAVAVRSCADFTTFYHCSFEGYQDTLYTHSLRQFFRECDIYGTIDFIFGNAAVVFQRCNIYARLPLHGQSIMLTAQGRTDPNQNTGISIMNSKILSTPELSGARYPVRSYLGRPWMQYSRTVVMRCSIGSFVDPAGWSPWEDNFALATLYYGEYENSGVGANTTNRVRWPGYHVMTFNDTSNFTVVNFVEGVTWLPRTAVPFSLELESILGDMNY